MNSLWKGRSAIWIAIIISLVSIGFFISLRQTTAIYKTSDYAALYKPARDTTLEDWKVNFQRYNYQKGNLEPILRDSVGIIHGESTIRKVEKIADFIIKYTEGRFGNQNLQVLMGLDPYEQLCAINIGESGVLCGMVSFIYAYFLENAGITSRYISLEKFNDSVVGTHVILEIFIPETGKWIYSDLTFAIKYVKTGAGLLNLLQLIELSKTKTDVLQFKMKQEKIQSFKELPADYKSYITSINEIRFFPGKQLRNSLLPFTISQKIYQKINPDFAYIRYADTTDSFQPYWLHRISRWLLVISLVYLTLVVIKR